MVVETGAELVAILFLLPVLFIGALIGWITSALVAVGSAIATTAAAIVPILHLIWDKIFAVFGRVANVVGRFAKSVAEFVRPVWDNFLKPVVVTLKGWWDRFTEFLRRVITPIANVVKRVSEIIDKIYDRFVSPVLDWLERARFIFNTLAELGVDWARSVADFIQQVQRRITETFQYIQDQLNVVSTFLSDLLDPGGWIKGAPFLNSFVKWGGAVMSIMVTLGFDPDATMRFEEKRRRHIPKPLPDRVEQFRRLEVKQHPAVRQAISDFLTLQTKRGGRRRV